MVKISEEEKKDKIVLEITLPTAEKVIETLRAFFPGISVTVKGEQAEGISDEEAEEIVEETHVED